jgi:hypothetical protein
VRDLRACRAALATGFFLVVALALAASAAAVPPTLVSVSVQNRHPGAVFSAPRADFGAMYFSSTPDRATDGHFLAENVKLVETLADSELQSGRWSSENQLDPGAFWVMVHVSPDFSSCWIFDVGAYDPACADGFSNVATLVVPPPRVRYTSRVTVYRFIRRVSLELRAAPLGERRPYRLCYPLRRGSRCLRGTLDGFSWNSAASDILVVSTRPLRTFMTFKWFVGTTQVASRRVRVR